MHRQQPADGLSGISAGRFKRQHDTLDRQSPVIASQAAGFAQGAVAGDQPADEVPRLPVMQPNQAAKNAPLLVLQQVHTEDGPPLSVGGHMRRVAEP